MRRKVISSASVLSVLLCTILSLSAIDSGVGIAKADSVIATLPVGGFPEVIAFDSDNGNLYVTNFDDSTVSVISGQTNSVIGSPIMLGSDPQGIAFDSDNGNLYVTNAGDNTVSVISTTHSTTVRLNPITPSSLPWGTTVKVTGTLSDNIAGHAGLAGKTITFTSPNTCSNSSRKTILLRILPSSKTQTIFVHRVYVKCHIYYCLCISYLCHCRSSSIC